MTGFPDHRQQSTRPQLPAWLDRYTTLGVYGLLVGTGLCLVAYLTNPVPDPSFPWATMPESLRLPIVQPRIEHWPVTYTIGIWLWVFCFPALFLAGYRRYGDGNRGAAVWLIGLPTVAMLGWTSYCRFFWPKLHPPTWNARPTRSFAGCTVRPTTCSGATPHTSLHCSASSQPSSSCDTRIETDMSFSGLDSSHSLLGYPPCTKDTDGRLKPRPEDL